MVDDAIVESMNIVRHMRMGKKPYAPRSKAADGNRAWHVAIS